MNINNNVYRLVIRRSTTTKSSSTKSFSTNSDNTNDEQNLLKKLQKMFEKKQALWNQNISPITQWRNIPRFNLEVGYWMKKYENLIGLSEVKEAQDKVIEVEKIFVDSQERRRDAQRKISNLQSAIKSIHAELEKTTRGEDRYLALLTQEHQVLKEERASSEEFHYLEKVERQNFAILSNALRDSHEKERTQANKTKYWSVIGSVVGTCLGILGTTINNRMRMKELKKLVVENSSNGENTSVHKVTDQILQYIIKHEYRLDGLIKKLNASLENGSKTLRSIQTSMNNVEEMRNSNMRIFANLERSFRPILYKQDQTINSIDTINKTLKQLVKESQNDKKYSDRIFHRTVELEDKIRDIRSLLLSQKGYSKAQESIPFLDQVTTNKYLLIAVGSLVLIRLYASSLL